MLPYIVCNLGDVRIVESSVDFVQNEKRRRLIAAGLFEPRTKILRASRAPMDSEKKGQRCDRLFSSRELVHVAEPLHRWHSMVVDTAQVRFLRVPSAKEERSGA
jgi:hypothetical protein